MKFRLLLGLALTLSLLTAGMLLNTRSARGVSNYVDGETPPHAVYTDGSKVPSSSASQPDKPIIFSKDSNDPKWGECKPEAAFDHTKHNTDPKHAMDGKNFNACVYCHHTDQPSASGGEPYFKKFERKAILTAAQLDSSKEPVKGCRNCHFRKPPRKPPSSHPKAWSIQKLPASHHQENSRTTSPIVRSAFPVTRSSKQARPSLKGPTGCADCHVKKCGCRVQVGRTGSTHFFQTHWFVDALDRSRRRVKGSDN